MGVSPFVGGLRGSATCGGRAKGRNGSLGNMVSRGEKRPSSGVGGTSIRRMPPKSDPGKGGGWRGLLVIVSTRGDMRASSSAKVAAGIIETCVAAEGAGARFSGRASCGGLSILRGTKPPMLLKPASPPNPSFSRLSLFFWSL